MDTREELAAAIIKKAEAGKHSDFTYIQTFAGLKVALKYRHAVNKLAHKFQKAAKDVLKSYTKDVGLLADIKPLIQYKHLLHLAAFYAEEAMIAEESIEEYHCYVHSGHIVDSLIGLPRPDDDLTDYRKTPRIW